LKRLLVNGMQDGEKNGNFIQFFGSKTPAPPVRTYGSSFHGLRFAKRISVGKLCSGNFGLRKMSPVEGRMSQLMGESLGDHLLVRGVFV